MNAIKPLCTKFVEDGSRNLDDPKQAGSFFSNVPNELLLEILNYSYPPALSKLNQTCRRLYILTEQHCQSLVQRHFPSASFVQSWTKTFRIYQMTLDNIISGKNLTFTLPETEWRYQNDRHFLGDKMVVECRLKEDMKRKSLAIWNLADQKYLTSIPPQSEERILSWGCDHTSLLYVGFEVSGCYKINVWDVHTGENLHGYEIKNEIIHIWIRDSYLFVLCLSQDDSTMCSLQAFDTQSHQMLWEVPQISKHTEGTTIPIGGFQIDEGLLRIAHFGQNVEWRSLNDGSIHCTYPQEAELSETSQNITVCSGAELFLFLKVQNEEEQIQLFKDQSLSCAILRENRAFILYKEQTTNMSKLVILDCKKGSKLQELTWPEEYFESNYKGFCTFEVLSENFLLFVNPNGTFEVWDLRSSSCINKYSPLSLKHLVGFSFDKEYRRFIVQEVEWGEHAHQVTMVDFSHGLPKHLYPARKESENNLYQKV